MKNAQPSLLKLQAKDAEDVQVISAILQDAIVPLCDMTYRPEDTSFILVAQRLRKEASPQNQDCGCERICSALDIRGVKSVRTHNLDSSECAGQMLELLMMQLEDNVLTLLFAGDCRVKLNLNAWSLKLLDFGEPWPVACSPCHDNPPSTDKH